MWLLALLVLVCPSIPALTLPLTQVVSSSDELEEDRPDLLALEQTIEMDLYDKVTHIQVRYEVGVTIGTPPQKFSLMIDTTFPYIAVVDSACSYCVTSDTFHKDSSQTYSEEDGLTTVAGISGILGNDTVAVYDDTTLKVPNQTILVVQHDSKEMFNKGVGAMVAARQGLGLERPFRGHISFVENLKKQGIIKSAVFAIYLGKFVEPPSISFGTWDLPRYSTSDRFALIPADTSTGNWAFRLDEATYGNSSLTAFPAEAIIDSTEKKLIVPKSVFDVIRDWVCRGIHCFGDEHTFGYVCSDLKRDLLPNITFTLNDHLVSISAEYYVSVRIRKKSSNKCIAQVNWREGQTAWLLGFPFMRSHYLLFNVEESVVGIAPALQEETLPVWVIVLICLVVVAVVGSLLFTILVCLDLDNCNCCRWRRKLPAEVPLLQ